MSDFALGQPVSFTSRLARLSERNKSGRGTLRTWTPTHTLRGHDKPVHGIIVGKRTLANGVRVWEGDDSGDVFLPAEYVTAHLVATDLHRKPVHVLPEHITVTGGAA